MNAAVLVLEAGGSIETLIPTLRPALAAVPPHERDSVGLDLAIMRVLVAHVLERHPPDPNDRLPDGQELSKEDAQWMGEFWYSAAAGEWVLNSP